MADTVSYASLAAGEQQNTALPACLRVRHCQHCTMQSTESAPLWCAQRLVKRSTATLQKPEYQVRDNPSHHLGRPAALSGHSQHHYLHCPYCCFLAVRVLLSQFVVMTMIS